jgi:hypothetical protein
MQPLPATYRFGQIARQASCSAVGSMATMPSPSFGSKKEIGRHSPFIANDRNQWTLRRLRTGEGRRQPAARHFVLAKNLHAACRTVAPMGISYLGGNELSVSRATPQTGTFTFF